MGVLNMRFEKLSGLSLVYIWGVLNYKSFMVWVMCTPTRCFKLEKFSGLNFVYTHVQATKFVLRFKTTFIWIGNDPKAKYGLIDISKVIILHCIDMLLNSRHDGNWWWFILMWGWKVASSKYCSQWGFLEVSKFKTIDP